MQRNCKDDPIKGRCPIDHLRLSLWEAFKLTAVVVLVTWTVVEFL